MKEIYTKTEDNKETQMVIYDLPLAAVEPEGIVADCSLLLHFATEGDDKKLYIGTDETISIYNTLKDFFND